MKSKKQQPDLVPVADTLDGFENFFEQSHDEQNAGVWAEPQFFLLPICVPQDKHSDRFRVIKITETVKVGDQTKQRSFLVNPHPELGLPGSFELEVMTGVYRLADIQLQNLGYVPEYIDIGTLRSFLTLIGKPYSGKYAAMLKEAFKRLMGTICVSEGFFYSKPRNLYIAESFTFISGVEFAGETDFNGNTYEQNRVRLHEYVRENLNANFRTLIDFDYVRVLKTDIAKPLSLHIAYRIFKNKCSEWIVDYDWLADRLAIRRHDVLWRARDQFKSALKELQDTGFLETWEWIGKKLKLVAGPRLVSMHLKRVQAKDAWLAHEQEKIRVEQLVISLPPRTTKEAERQVSFDPLAAICAEYAVRGWKAIESKAKARGLTEPVLLEEAQKRGHSVKHLGVLD
jgi:hypothetical protein